MKTLRSVPATWLSLLLVVACNSGGAAKAARYPKTSANTAARASGEAQSALSQSATAINEIARNATPAVVSIVTVKKGDIRSLALGSGVFIKPGGIVLTNNHVVENAERVTVNYDEHHKSVAEVLGTDAKTDLAVIRVKDMTQFKDAKILSLGDSEKVKVGDWAIAIGSPFGLKRTVSVGIVSATGRGHMGVLDTEDFIQTDAAINPGSSGGPLLSSKGEIIGINTAIFSQTGGFIGIGFAIPSRIAGEVAEELITHGKVPRGWIGLMAQDLDDELSRYFNVPKGQGALVTHVLSDGPAGNAHLRAGDVITRFAGKSIDSANQLKAFVARTPGDTEIALNVIRDGKELNPTVLIGAQPAVGPTPPTQLAGLVPKSQETSPLGLAVRDVTPELSSLLQLPPKAGALIVAVQPGSPAFDSGLLPGDIVLQANHTSVRSAKEFSRLAAKASESGVTVLYVRRGPPDAGERLFVPLKNAPAS